MSPVLIIRARRVVAAALAAVLLVGAAPTRPAGAEAAPDPVATTYRSLAEAAEAGAVDPGLVPQLRTGKPVDLFAVLDGRAVLAAYGNGDPRRVRQAAELLAAQRSQVQHAIEGRVQVLRAYQLVPLLYVRVAGEESALMLVNLVAVLSLTANQIEELVTKESLPLVRQPQAAAMGQRGAGTSVAVLDSGADFTLPDFGNCTAPGVPVSCRVPAAVEIAPNDGAVDDIGHGTNVAGIVAAVAPAARIIPLDVTTGTKGYEEDIVAGLDWVLQNRATFNIRAVNMSTGRRQTYNLTTCDGGGPFGRDPFLWPFTALRQAGTMPVVAAGNDAMTGGFHDGIEYPSCVLGAVSVGAVYDDSLGELDWGDCVDLNAVADQPLCYTQDAPILSILAPGAMIRAGGFEMAGTSQAAPHVAGAFAVLAAARPLASAAELESYVTTSATTLTDPKTGRNHPRLDLFAAVNAALQVTPPANDMRANARVLSTFSGQLDQSTWGATLEHAEGSPGASVWFRWTPPQAGTIVFDTTGSDFDTSIEILWEHPTWLELISWNEDAAPGVMTSLAGVWVNVGWPLLIKVGGAPSAGGVAASGHLHLTWNLANDAVAGAVPIGPGVTAGSNVGATHEAGEPYQCDDTYASASVWYQWTPAAGTTTARVRSTSTMPLCVAVYRTTGTTAAYNLFIPVDYGLWDGPVPIDFTFPVVPGSTYWFAVDGVSIETNCSPVTGQCFYTTPTGTFTLTLTA